MTFTPTKLKDCYIIDPNVIKDDRGYFMESFNESRFEAGTGMNVHFVQDNQSFSSKGVLRGLHYQVGEHSQAKLIRVIQGAVLDVAVDIRPGSETYGQYEAVLLSDENQRQLFIPRGFAHGFLVLSDTAIFFYKCDNFYHKESEAGIIYNDPDIGIDWGMPEDAFVISHKDKVQSTFKDSRPVW